MEETKKEWGYTKPSNYVDLIKDNLRYKIQQQVAHHNLNLKIKKSASTLMASRADRSVELDNLAYKKQMRAQTQQQHLS